MTVWDEPGDLAKHGNVVLPAWFPVHAAYPSFSHVPILHKLYYSEDYQLAGDTTAEIQYDS